MRTSTLILAALALPGCLGLESFPGKDDFTPGEDSGWSGGALPVDDTGDTGEPGEPIGGDTGYDANAAPVADAGGDQSGEAGVVITLDGSGSYDPDGDPLDYAWEILRAPTGSTATLSDPDLADTQLYLDAAGAFEIELTVSDGALDDSDVVLIDVEDPNERPVANAGSDQTISVGTTAILDAGGSYDPDGDPLSYSWVLVTPPGSSAALSNTSAPTPTFVADVEGNYTANLTVNDGSMDSNPDSVNVTAQAGSSGGGSGGSSGCSCAEPVRSELERRYPVLSAMKGSAGFLLPALVAFARRRRAGGVDGARGG